MNTVFQDRGVEREIGSLRVRCRVAARVYPNFKWEDPAGERPANPNICVWVGELRDLERHLERYLQNVIFGCRGKNSGQNPELKYNIIDALHCSHSQARVYADFNVFYYNLIC